MLGTLLAVFAGHRACGLRWRTRRLLPAGSACRISISCCRYRCGSCWVPCWRCLPVIEPVDSAGAPGDCCPLVQ
ncbi:hypothetical protein CQA72_29440, partial [Klebsiella pneumoniae]